MPTNHYDLGPVEVIHTQGEEEITLVVKEVIRRPDGALEVEMDTEDIVTLYEVLKSILS